MSKKTRKKSSKPAPKSRNTPARKPPAAKTASKATRRSEATSAKKPAAKTASKAASKTAGKPASKTAKSAAKATVRKPDKTAEAAAPKASHKPPSKPLKSNLSAPPKPDVGTELVEGAMARPFSLPRDGGGNVSLADYAGKKLVLFFYPRADTPGCTREAIDFTRLESAFADEGAAVLGVSADTVKAQESFRNKHQLSVPLISDEQHEMLEAYGAWGEKSMYGRNFMGIIRMTVLIGADGRVARIWRNVRVDGHADEVLAAVRAI
jgi:thioredoxin-dependent peroxiredoxin